MLKTGIFGLFTLLISVGGFAAAMNMKENPWPGFLLAFGIIFCFFWNLNYRWKKADEKRIRERLFKEYMHNRPNFRNH